MLISGGNARPFEICSLIFAFCPAEAGKFSEFFKGLSRYHAICTTGHILRYLWH